ncbi:MAG: hypothetical protein OEW70_07930 [candidate division WOR-3 bacterium]|nr:hypothetical protein [candidate division WOR-3 bacterium]
MGKIPNHLKKYFWEIDIKTISPKKYWYYIIERILEYGDIKALCWLFKTYSARRIKQIVMKTRNLSPQSINFWVNYFNLDSRRVNCLKKSCRKDYGRIWQY